MLVAEVLSEVRSRGVELVAAGDRLRFRPVSALPSELVEKLREHKTEIIETLTREIIETPSDVLALARECLPVLKDEDRVDDLDDLVRANQPPEPGRDPLTKRGTNKAQFFGGDWRKAWPQDFEVHKGGSTSQRDPTEAEERAITREVLRLNAELSTLVVRQGRIVIPDDATKELAEKIRRYEGELLWARGYESGPRWGCSWVPASGHEMRGRK